MKARIVNAIAGFFVFLFCATALAARDDVLIIVNDNSIDSPQVGTYYAQQRNIAAANIVHVKVPNQYYVDWAQFLSLRDQILRFGICPSVPSTSRPAACSDPTQAIYTTTNINALTATTKIRYIVTTRGVPSRMTVDGSTLPDPSSSTSVDNYLRFWLARYIQSDVTLAFGERSTAFGDGRGMRIVNPPIDKEYIIGRIDGVDLASAKALVDRAIRVEANGLYGKLYGSTFGSTGGESKWTNYATTQPIYLPADNSQNYWRYAFGLFGENRPECSNYVSNYLSFSQGVPNGKTPNYCLAQFNLGTPNDAIAGLSYSRQPIAVDAMVYFGSLDGQGVEGGFPTLLNWRKNDSCTVTLCDNALDPVACRSASVDPFKEIDTACVGVADGFIGYNFQSFPVSVLGIWPTGWGPTDVDRNDVPEIKNTDGQNGTYSAWFSQPDDGINPSCYAYDKVNNTLGSSSLCPSRQWVGLRQVIPIPSPLTPISYRFSFYLKGGSSTISTTLSSSVRASYYKDPANSAPQPCPTTDPHYTLDSASTCTYTDVANHQISSNWVQYSRDITAPVLSGWKNTQLQIIFGNNQLPQGGSVGFDTISLKNLSDPTNPELIVNGSFDQGHKQAAMGDYASNFLSRLGGTAFWGSLSHHQSSGHSFDKTSLGTLIYFMKGLPLGDAVWLGEQNNSGVFYGDPIYSPISIKFNYPVTADILFIGNIPLSGNTKNGQDFTRVTTIYSIEYCAGRDFFQCDLQSSWRPTGLSGTGGQINQQFGAWSMGALPAGDYTLRLAVRSTNPAIGKTQLFYDYYPITTYDPNADADGDGLSNGDEVKIYHTNPLNKDTDGDGLSDGAEIKTYHTDPLKADTDGDGYYDGVEIAYGMNPLKADRNVPWMGTVSGRITTPDGKGVGGITFWDVSKYPQTTTTDENGYFVIRGYTGGESVFFNMFSANPAYTYAPSGWDGSTFKQDGGTIVARNFIATLKAGTVKGRVTLNDGSPLANAKFWDVSKYPTTVTTALDGSFVGQGYSSGDNVWFNTTSVYGYTLTANGWNGSPVIHDGATKTGFDFLALQKAGTISGRITTPDGKAVAGLTFWDVSKYPATITTNADGHYVLEGYKAGDSVLFNMYNATTNYTITTSGWNNLGFKHDGSAVKNLNFIAVPK